MGIIEALDPDRHGCGTRSATDVLSSKGLIFGEVATEGWSQCQFTN